MTRIRPFLSRHQYRWNLTDNLTRSNRALCICNLPALPNVVGAVRSGRGIRIIQFIITSSLHFFIRVLAEQVCAQAFSICVRLHNTRCRAKHAPPYFLATALSFRGTSRGQRFYNPIHRFCIQSTSVNSWTIRQGRHHSPSSDSSAFLLKA